MTTKPQPKRRVTLSLAPETLQTLDAEAQAQGRSRSAALAHLLSQWQGHATTGKQEATELEATTAAYYSTQDDTDRTEDDDWAAFAGQAAARAWPRT